MQNLPFANTDTRMAPLMTLVTIMAAKIMYLSLMIDVNLIDRKDTKTRPFEF